MLGSFFTEVAHLRTSNNIKMKLHLSEEHLQTAASDISSVNPPTCFTLRYFMEKKNPLL